MKKTASTILFITLFFGGFSQSYKEELKKINDYLKTFDKGYYGYLEIKDGYLYDRFSSGKYSKSEIKYLTTAYEEEYKRKVSIKCKDDKDCVYSTYTDSYHKSVGFSQSTDFNTAELITMLNNLLAAYNGSSNTISTTKNNNTTTNYNTALQKLNDYLKTFDNGYYGYFEVKDGYIYDRFKAGKYNKFKMEDIQGAVIQEEYKRVIFKCKSGSCISTDWKENGKEDYTQFTTGSAYNYQQLATLLNNFRDAYLGNSINTSNGSLSVAEQKAADIRAQREKERKQQIIKTKANDDDDDFEEDWNALAKAAAPLSKVLKETNNNTNSNYQTALKRLNDYLKTFNAETYREVEVKDGKVYFGFFVYGAKYNSSIDINELKNNTIITIGKSVGSSVVDEVKIFCKNDKKYFYSTYSKSDADHFRFFSHTVKDFSKMEQLLKEFIKAL